MNFRKWLKLVEDGGYVGRYDPEHDPEHVFYTGNRLPASHGGDPSATSTYIAKPQTRTGSSQSTVAMGTQQLAARLIGVEQRLARVEQLVGSHG